MICRRSVSYEAVRSTVAISPVRRYQLPRIATVVASSGRVVVVVRKLSLIDGYVFPTGPRMERNPLVRRNGPRLTHIDIRAVAGYFSRIIATQMLLQAVCNIVMQTSDSFIQLRRDKNA